MTFTPITLAGNHIRLEPLAEHHKSGLCRAIEDGNLWQLFVTSVPHPNDIDTFFENAHATVTSGEGLVFATIDQASNKVIGSTRFMRSNLANKRSEIGFTFLAQSAQRTKANSEAKLLMLTHCFETLGFNRVEFLTDFLNQTSRAAILRLGAKQEGVLRSHVCMPNGRIRDSVIFSITAPDWPGVKQNLIFKLG
tara:strand:+ start:3434 stop:4015 length:582 start_codon:yes stop_codon:yes gene_type:complete